MVTLCLIQMQAAEGLKVKPIVSKILLAHPRASVHALDR